MHQCNVSVFLYDQGTTPLPRFYPCEKRKQYSPSLQSQKKKKTRYNESDAECGSHSLHLTASFLPLDSSFFLLLGHLNATRSLFPMSFFALILMAGTLVSQRKICNNPASSLGTRTQGLIIISVVAKKKKKKK
jgi:hypothetical protein